MISAGRTSPTRSSIQPTVPGGGVVRFDQGTTSGLYVSPVRSLLKRAAWASSASACVTGRTAQRPRLAMIDSSSCQSVGVRSSTICSATLEMASSTSSLLSRTSRWAASCLNWSAAAVCSASFAPRSARSASSVESLLSRVCRRASLDVDSRSSIASLIMAVTFVSRLDVAFILVSALATPALVVLPLRSVLSSVAGLSSSGMCTSACGPPRGRVWPCVRSGLLPGP